MLRPGIGVALGLILYISVADAGPCENLGYSPPTRFLSINGVVKNISLYWGSDPAHAASALFYVILRYAHGYKNVQLVKGPHSLVELAKSLQFNPSQQYDNAALALSTGWDPIPQNVSEHTPGASYGLGNPRLQQIAANILPASVRLHVYLTKYCEGFTDWRFYTNAVALETCGFINPIARNINATVYVIQDSSNRTTRLAKLLKTRANASSLLVQFKELDRKRLFEKLRSASESFLFIDYGMWSNRSNVHVIQQPPCLADEGPTCLPQMDAAIDMRLSEIWTLSEYARQLFQLFHVFSPSLDSLTFILEQNANGTNIEEAACDWINKNNNTVYDNWVDKYEANKNIYNITIFCTAQNNNIEKQYMSFFYKLRQHVSKIYKSNFDLSFSIHYRTYFNINYIKDEINYYMKHSFRQRLIGAIVGGDNIMTEVATSFDKMDILILSYDVATVDMDSTKTVWLTTGRSLHLAIAMRHFITKNNWTRVAVLSDPTVTAKRFINDLVTNTEDPKETKKLVFRNFDYTLLNTKKVLSELYNQNARIIIVNTRYKDAVTILTEATKLNMNSDTDYVWIVREWGDFDGTLNVKHFTMTFRPPRGDDLSKRFSNLCQKMNTIWPGCNWPRQAVAILDAVLTMAQGFNDVIFKYPQAREETHTEKVFQQFEQSLIEISPIKGSQDLVYKNHSIDETLVYVDQWQGSNLKTLAKWRVSASANKVKIEHEHVNSYFKYGIPHDGTTKCLISKGDPYSPTCYDFVLIGILALLLVAVPVAAVVYWAVRRHLQKIQMEILGKLLSERQQRVAALSDYLVKRSTLKICDVIGSGKFGLVMQAELCVPGSRVQTVAAKELRDHQDENEILREACILAFLKHDNIIRLVGVCIDNEPILVLMDLALFGDLLQYLRKRRYLAEGAEFKGEDDITNTEEAAHISAKALTRMAREAASALAYLALRGVVHRDLRASNCLVDARRSLKVADFGLARETKATGLDSTGEYACRRRGVFPVLWMAPESLMYGVFSPASDVYSLGVLMFELVTLGARPYGTFSPLRVMQYVTSGGKPLMPLDATPQTNALAQLCWERQPEKRPTAADIVAYLAERPTALNPALDYKYYEFTDADSGYGNSPSTELLLSK